jgi:3-methyladenine DNA glycosylase AlkD
VSRNHQTVVRSAQLAYLRGDILWKYILSDLPRKKGESARSKSAMKRIPTLATLKRELARAADPERARNLAWFFKTGVGEYGEGDKFIGLTVPAQRAISKKYRHLELDDIGKLLASRIHEHRFTGLLILVAQYKAGDAATKQRVFAFYLDHTRCINNWDLVDTSAPYIVGEHLILRPRRVLYRLAKSSDLWERRIAMVATAAFIRRGELKDTFAIATCLLGDKHDLIHKAIGWMLREAGKQSRTEMIDFLRRNYSRMPRTALRYAIERLPETQRKRALRGVFV